MLLKGTKAKTVLLILQHQAHLFLLSSIFPLSFSTDYQMCFGPVESEVTKLFLIQLKADCCVIVFRAEAIEHILKFAEKDKKKKKRSKK